MGLRLNQLQATITSVFDDIFHLRTTGGLDKKITMPNLRQAIQSYTEISANFTAPETASEVNKVQIFKNIGVVSVYLTLGTSGIVLALPSNFSARVLYTGSSWVNLDVKFSATSIYPLLTYGDIPVAENLGQANNFTTIWKDIYEFENTLFSGQCTLKSYLWSTSGPSSVDGEIFKNGVSIWSGNTSLVSPGLEVSIDINIAVGDTFLWRTKCNVSNEGVTFNPVELDAAEIPFIGTPIAVQEIIQLT